MSERAPARLALVVTVLAAAAAGVLLWGYSSPGVTRGGPGAFQRAVGGLGGGAAPVTAPCEPAFDAAMQPDCTFDHLPVPGGGAYCPVHAGPSLRR